LHPEADEPRPVRAQVADEDVGDVVAFHSDMGNLVRATHRRSWRATDF